MMQKSIQRYSYDCRARTDSRLFGNLGVLISNRILEVFRKVNLLYGMTTEGEMYDLSSNIQKLNQGDEDGIQT